MQKLLDQTYFHEEFEDEDDIPIQMEDDLSRCENASLF